MPSIVSWLARVAALDVAKLGYRPLVLGAMLSMAAIALCARAVWVELPNDVEHYFVIAARARHGDLPYVDFPLEYPPLSLVAFLLPYFLFEPYALSFLLTSALWLGGIGIALHVAIEATDSPTQTFAGLGLFLVLALLSAPVVPWRYDLFPAFLTAVSFACVLTGRPALAGACLGLGVAAKVYPLVLGPVLLMYFGARRQWSALTRTLCVGTAAATLPFAIAALMNIVAVVDTDAALSSLTYHSARGVQVESSYSGIVLLAGALDLMKVNVIFGWGSHNLSFAGERLLIALQGALTVAGLLVAYGACWRRLRDPQPNAGRSVNDLAACCAGVLMTFLATNKVLSPQYIAWLLPFASFLPRRQATGVAALFLLTVATFPVAYPSLLRQELPAILILNARNLLALVLVPWILLGPRSHSSP